MRLLTAAGLLVLSLTCITCQGGGITPDPVPTQTDILAVRTASVLRVHCEQSSADPGTQVQLIYPYFGQDTADEQGGFTITVQLPQTTSRASQALDEVHINYYRDGEVQLAKVSVIMLNSRVAKPLFSTGAAPNDMVFGNDSLYIANSMDNTLVRYGLDGEVLGTITYDEYASPSFLGLYGNNLYVTANGENSLRGFDAETLLPLQEPEVLCYFDEAMKYFDREGNYAFFGPGQPIASDKYVWVPTTSILTFDPLEYQESPLLIECMLEHEAYLNGYLQAYIINAQFGFWDPNRNWIFTVGTGELRFDEYGIPFVTSNSYIESIRVPQDMIGEQQNRGWIDLGPIGAGRIAWNGDTNIAFLGNSLNGNLYKVDMYEGDILRGEGNPIVLTEEFTFISDVAYTPDGKYILATSFNTDELYVIDALTDEVNPGPYPAPFDLSLDPELMAGCANIEIDPTPRADGGYDVYVLYGVANAVAKVELF